MELSTLAPWAALVGLGAAHGLNPGMGWLFAVALGMQDGSGRAVWRALGPLALGHALAILAVVGIGALAGVAIPERALRWVVAALLVSLGVFRVVRHSHVRYGGMRVSPRQLATWSVLMATAHGAGLMVLPFVLRDAPHHGHTLTASAASGPIMATLLHSAGYLLVTGAIAWLVYTRLGVRFLRSAWVNLDLIWALALVVTGLATPLL